jgi:hypothetical protein
MMNTVASENAGMTAHVANARIRSPSTAAMQTPGNNEDDDTPDVGAQHSNDIYDTEREPTGRAVISRREQQRAIAADVLRVLCRLGRRKFDDVETGNMRHLRERGSVRDETEYASGRSKGIVATLELDREASL